MSRKHYRLLFSFVILSAGIFVFATNFASASDHSYAKFQEEANRPAGEREAVAQPREGITVVTSHLGSAGDIVALAPNGTVLYHDGTHEGYWDVDPSPRGELTVVYTATDEVHNGSVCEPVSNRHSYCIEQTLEQVNLSTGETTVLYSRIDPRYHNSEWHDLDPINESHYVVADMYSDEVFVVNVSSGMVVWEWNAQNHLSLSTGGTYPQNWVHLNDVEVLEDGRIMASLRNQDQVVFIDPDRGVIDNWTLGVDDRHSVLYEQHNPDYIPRSNGGPAVLVADSENNRIVEYQRTPAGEWNRTWVWQDSRLQWGRDADRLPNGHTLVTDTHGGRIVEIDRRGRVIWRFDVPVAYEAERLNTGAESTGGPSARTAGLRSRVPSDERASGRQTLLVEVKTTVKGLFPNKVVNGVENATPLWVGLYDLVALLAGSLAALVWIGLELRWSGFEFRTPVVRE
jgi:hypothetical protein